jgi:hypothetical protein
MRSLAVFVVLAAALLLAACAPSAISNPTTLVPAELQPAEVQEEGAAKQLADRMFGAVSGAENRSARMAMLVAGLAELMADRVTQFDPQDADASLGRILRLKGVMQRFDQASEIWYETDIRLATLTITSILVEVGKDRVTSFLGGLVGGVSVKGILTRAEVVARQTAIADAVIADIRRAFADVAAGALTAAQVRHAAEQRLAFNEQRIGAVLGGPIGLAAP